MIQAMRKQMHVALRAAAASFTLLALLALCAFAAPPAFAGGAERGSFRDSVSNLREGPGTKFPVIEQPVAGTPFSVLEMRGEWLRVVLSGGPEGWVHAKNVRLGKSGHPLAFALAFDLDGDGAAETVGLELAKHEESMDTYRLAVARAGKIVWRDAKGAIRLIRGDGGSDELQVIGDLLGDGVIRLLVRDAQSDVSPASFRLLPWTGKGFEDAAPFSLVAREGKAAFLRRVPDAGDADGATWAMDFRRLLSPGRALARLFSMEGASVRAGEAVLRAGKDGFAVESFPEPMAPLGD